MNFQSNQFFELFKNTYGALSCCESIAIYNITQQAPAGTYLELGSHKGKSGMTAATGLKDGVFHLVDPIFEDYELASEVCELVSSCARNTLKVVYLAEYSTDIIERFDNLAYVFVDSGSHQDGLPMREVKMLEDRVMPGGIIAFHDTTANLLK
jgi:predicted O-methyltransferase YrrM